MSLFTFRGLILVSFFFGLTGLMMGATLRVDSPVDDGGSGTLREVIKGAATGDLILIRTEEITLDSTEGAIPITESIRIEGENGPRVHSISGSDSSIFQIVANAEVTIARLTLKNGYSADNGGAIVNYGNLTLESVVIKDSEADGSGGAIYSDGARLTIIGSHLYNNLSEVDGGAVAVSGGFLEVFSSGFGGNRAYGSQDGWSGNNAGQQGGALYIGPGVSADVISSTLSNNSAQDGGAIAISSDASLTAVNLTLVENVITSVQPPAETSHIAVGLNASLSLSNSLIHSEDAEIYGIGGIETTDLIASNDVGKLADLGLGDMGDYGGVSPTYPVLPGSPAIDSGDDGALDAYSDLRDQRGLARFSDGDGSVLDSHIDHVDKGAFEIQNYRVTAVQIRGSATGGADDEGFGNNIDPSDDAESIASANVFDGLSVSGKADIGDAIGANNAAGGGSVSFDPSLTSQTLFLKGSELKVRRNAAVYGAGAAPLTINGDDRSPLFRVSDGALLYIRDITLTNGRSIDGGGIVVEGDSFLEMEAVSIDSSTATASGGALAVLSGDAIIYRSTLWGNTAGTTGGAISGKDNSTLYINNSTISGNLALGVEGAHAIDSTGYLAMDSSTLVGGSPPAIQLNQGKDGIIWNSILLSGDVVSSGDSVVLTDTVSTPNKLNIVEVSNGPEEPVSYQAIDGNNLSFSDEEFIAGINYVATKPVVNPLADNGGTTLTHALAAGSEALNRGIDTGMSPVDQRGIDRPFGDDANDIGAVEMQNYAPEIVSTNNSVVVECGSLFSNSATASIVVSDVEEDPLTVTWKLGDVTYTDAVPAGQYEVSRTFTVPYGSTDVVVYVEDDYSRSAERTISISVVDNTIPSIAITGLKDYSVTADADCNAAISIPFAAGDSCTGIASITYKINEGASVQASLTSPIDLTLPVGTYTIVVTATDGAGLTASDTLHVKVEDNTNPILNLPANIVIDAPLGACAVAVSFEATATDCSGTSPIVYTWNGQTVNTGALFPVGVNTVDVSVKDGADNQSTGSFTITVVDKTPPEFASIPDDLIDDEANDIARALQTDPGFCSALEGFDIDVSDACSDLQSFTYSVRNPEGDLTEVYTSVRSEDGTTPVIVGMPEYRFEVGLNTVIVEAVDVAGNSDSVEWLVEVKDDGNNCLYNIAWPLAYELTLTDITPQPNTDETDQPKLLNGSFQQYLAFTDQSRWYKFFVKPGSRLTVLLSDLPANYDVVVYKDIQEEYDRIRALFDTNDPEDQKLALLGVEFAAESWSAESWSAESWSAESWSAESFSPDAFSAESFSAESFSAESFSAESFSAESWSAESWSAESFSPENWAAESFSAESWSAESFSPEVFFAESFSAESFSAESFSAESFSAESWSAESFSAESFSAESFSSAQIASIVGFSAFPGVASEGVSLNTFTESGYYYIRVRGSNGAFSTESPFTVNVFVQEDRCAEIITSEDLDANGDLQPYSEPITSGHNTLILWDSMLMQQDPLGPFASKLDALATAVGGVVVDVSVADRVSEANAVAELYPECIYAKNLVAEEIKKVIDLWWADNADTLEYIVLVGNDDIIPFFRTTDEALLANEANYIPPVKDFTHSQSALRLGQVLTQDPYGAACELNLRTGPMPYPDLAVGRLVESPEDIIGQIDDYIQFNGLIEPTSALSTGYDFLDDAAIEIQAEFEAALNGPVDTLIAASTVPPAEGWTATDLANAFLGKRHDMVFLAGHFSTGSALAADYETRLTASKVLDSNANLRNSLIFSIGCHSGYNTVDEHAVPGVTIQPDWSQVFGKMGATFIAGTGYQYGDTEFVEYGERLYVEFARELRTGTGPVSIGKALVNAKKRYLAQTPLMRGIHEKTILQTTLFGLPMMQINVPGSRIEPTSPEVANLESLGTPAAGPGAFFGLDTYKLEIFPSIFADGISPTTLDLEVEPLEPLGENEQKEIVTATWYIGKDGIVTNPLEPTRPLEVYNVSVPDNWLRGVGFRGGDYQEVYGVLPLTGAPATEIRGAYGNFFTETFYPSQPYSTNYFGALCGSTDGEQLNVFPTQFISKFPDDKGLGGTYRAYDRMEFKLFYNNDTSAWGDPGSEVIPALAGPPTIASVRSEIVGDTVEFYVNVVGSPAAGIQEVWITHTRDVGISATGTWESEGLTQDSNDSTLWTGTWHMPVGSTDAEAIAAFAESSRFIVQAASGTGMVSLSTNFGRYYIPGRDNTIDKARTQIEFTATPPTSVRYGDVITVSAKLTDRASPANALAEEEVEFRVGTSRIRGTTDVNGVIEKTFEVTTQPRDNLFLQANYAGSEEYAATSFEVPFLVEKQLTTLTPVDEPLDEPVYGSEIVFALSAGSDIEPNESTPLKERTIFFLVEYLREDGTVYPPDEKEKIGTPVITDYLGRADLSEVFLEAGKARITAYFNDIVLPNGETVSISDELYEPADPVSIVVTLRQPPIEDSLGFDPTQVDVYYKSAGKGKNAGPPIYSNASLTGEVAFNVNLQPQQILDALDTYPASPYIDVRVEARLAGQTIASGVVELDTRGDNGNHWTTTSIPGSEIAYVGIHWSDAPRFDSDLSVDPPEIDIYTTFIGNNFAEYHIVPRAETDFTVQLPNGGPVIEFKDGKPQESPKSFLAGSDYTWDEVELAFSVKDGLLPGDSFEIEYLDDKGNSTGTETVTAELGTNYLEEGGRMIVRLEAVDGTPTPTSDATPNYLECRVILGPEDGVHVRSIARVGEGLFAVPWSSEDPGHKQYRP